MKMALRGSSKPNGFGFAPAEYKRGGVSFRTSASSIEHEWERRTSKHQGGSAAPLGTKTGSLRIPMIPDSDEVHP